MYDCLAHSSPAITLPKVSTPQGKTRLALAVAHALAGDYPDGVWFVELAPLADPALVPQAVAAALGVREQPGRPLVDQLADALRGRDCLLVLDNCEHLVDACAALAEAFLAACPQLRVLATSREPLRVPGEAVWPVPPLAAPDPAQLPSLAALGDYPAVRLFAERARAQQPTFALTAGNARPVAALCRRLDGIPLALELAAARVRALPPGELAARLDDALRLLGGGSRTAPSRHQTLRATLDWSYRLLDPAAQVLFRWLAVFAGGWTLAAAEAVCAATSDERGATSTDGNSREEGADERSSLLARRSSLDMLEGLARLVDQSLVVVEPDTAPATGSGAARYRLLEPVRQYAAEQLAACGEEECARDRHAAHYAALAEGAAPALTGPEGAPGWRGWRARRATCAPRSAGCTSGAPPSAACDCVGRCGPSGVCAASRARAAAGSTRSWHWPGRTRRRAWRRACAWTRCWAPRTWPSTKATWLTARRAPGERSPSRAGTTRPPRSPPR